jgi:hypothetical protein
VERIYAVRVEGTMMSVYRRRYLARLRLKRWAVRDLSDGIFRCLVNPCSVALNASYLVFNAGYRC